MDGTLTVDILKRCLPHAVIEEFADELDVVERQRKVDVVVLVWSLILGFPAGAKRTIASLRRRFEQVGSCEIARSSFYDRLTPAVAELMRRLVDWWLDLQTAETDHCLADAVDGFKELLAVDSTLLRLHELLAPTWEATHDGDAAAKMHVVANVVSGGPNSVELTDQRTHDSQLLKTVGTWVEGCLLMGDLAYYDFHLFHRIDKQDGYFLSRVKEDANPRIVATNQTHRGRSIDLVGCDLQDVLDRLKRQTIDVTVALEVQLRKYRGRSRTTTRHFRLVGTRNNETGEYYLYYTNVDSESLDPEQLRQTCRLRWQIELLFSRMDEVDASPPPAPVVKGAYRPNPDLGVDTRRPLLGAPPGIDASTLSRARLPSSTNGRRVPGFCRLVRLPRFRGHPMIGVTSPRRRNVYTEHTISG